MIKTQCRYLALSEVDDLDGICEYKKMVHPISYEFDLIRGNEYFVLGALTRHGTPWLYIAPIKGDKQLRLVPSALFMFDWKKVPKNWFIRFLRYGEIELLPASMVTIDGWFEKYVDDDINVVKIVEEEIDRLCTG
ncbi:hypothetical protein [Methylovulum psychrotolerans]|uniref:Uncharacterized protein n=1 Tax=Methylovulum psychrotolerans TaxID=1704499 RepID=A0A2S5CHL1_9GAMM|nr:hypothetical protein [Methylovulum psychrotolerans]POZ50298.1 hypothetical protein AADEFJLK_03882 [Methylovulum psychrotolerans]